MVTKKNLVIAVLVTFCLTAIIFMVIPIRSSINPYDPWLDYDENGKINLEDLVRFANSYGTTGDPTKNVNVTNLHNYEIQTGTINFSSSISYATPTIFCGGYSRISMLLASNQTNIGNGSITIYLESIDWENTGGAYSGGVSYESLGGSNAFNITISGSQWWFPSSYLTETKAPYCIPYFSSTAEVNLPANWWVTVNYVAYLRNE
jgi:hypothetical protein